MYMLFCFWIYYVYALIQQSFIWGPNTEVNAIISLAYYFIYSQEQGTEVGFVVTYHVLTKILQPQIFKNLFCCFSTGDDEGTYWISE